MKLFDKYLLACTNQRIPMPEEWQSSLGLSLSSSKQDVVEDSVHTATLTGYRFQQDETLHRGYVHRQVRTAELDRESTYLLQLYLQALEAHKQVSAEQYLCVGETHFSFPNYILTADVLSNRAYTIYGRTAQAVSIKLYNTLLEEPLIAEVTHKSLDVNSPLVIDISDMIDKYLLSGRVRQGVLIPSLSNYFTIDGLLFRYTSEGKIAICNPDKPIIEANAIVGYVAESEVRISVTSNVFICNSNAYKLTISSNTVTAVERELQLKDLQAIEEYYTLEILSTVPVALVAGGYPKTPFYKSEPVEVRFKHAVAYGTGAQHGLEIAVYLGSTTAYARWFMSSISLPQQVGSSIILTRSNTTMFPDADITFTVTCVPRDSRDFSYNTKYYEVSINAAFQTTSSFDAQVVLTSKGTYLPLLLSKSGYLNLPYSNKLIPTLLDMNITDESPLEERELLNILHEGETYKEKIMMNTPGMFDVDDNIGEELIW